MKSVKFVVIQLILVCLLISCSFKENAKNNDIIIENAYARVIPNMNNGTIYIDIINNSRKPYNLVSASSDIASKIEFHSVKNNNGILKMYMKKSIGIPPKSTLNFRLVNLHLMLINLNQNLQSGDEFKLNLKFDNDLEKSVIVKINNDNIYDEYVDIMHHDDIDVDN